MKIPYCPGFPHHFPMIFPCLSDSPAPLAWRVWRRPEKLRELDNFSDFSSRSVLRQPKATSSWKMSRMAWWPIGRRGRWEILNWEINLRSMVLVYKKLQNWVINWTRVSMLGFIFQHHGAYGKYISSFEWIDDNINWYIMIYLWLVGRSLTGH